MRKYYKHISIILTSIILSTVVLGQEFPNKPNPARLVNDFTGTLSLAERNSLEQKLIQFDRATSNQIMLIIVPSLNSYEVSEYTEIIGEKWGVGQKDNDNGIVILVKPKTGRENGKAHIAIGYGLEGVVPDAIANRIMDNEMIPHFKQNDYYSGLSKATDVLISLTEGEYTAADYKEQTKGNSFGMFVPIFVIFLVLLSSRRRGRRFQTMGGSSSSLLGMMFLGSMMGRSSHGGSWDNFSSGGGSFGGGSSFGGFGGGGFGGGGASGSW